MVVNSWPRGGLFNSMLWPQNRVSRRKRKWPRGGLFNSMLWHCFFTVDNSMAWPRGGLFNSMLWLHCWAKRNNLSDRERVYLIWCCTIHNFNVGHFKISVRELFILFRCIEVVICVASPHSAFLLHHFILQQIYPVKRSHCGGVSKQIRQTIAAPGIIH